MFRTVVNYLCDSKSAHDDLSRTVCRKSSRNSAGKRRDDAQLSFLKLENRELLAASIAFDAANATVFIYGTVLSDSATASVVNSSQFRVSVVNGDSQTFNNSDVSKLTFYGNAGNDFFQNNTAISSHFGGGTGNDEFHGGSARDTAFGADGLDKLYGRGGDDLLNGGNGVDQVFGGDGIDQLHGGRGNDVIHGDAGADVIYAEHDDDTVYGGSGNDTIFAFTGDDTVYGEDGDDLVYGQFGSDTIHGGNGNDRLRGNHATDYIYGDAGADYLLGDTGDDVIFGGSGNDTIISYDGNDTINGGDGDDNLYAGLGDDTVSGDAGNDLIGGDVGNDVLRGGSGNDVIYGNSGNDVLYGDDGTDRLVGNDGDDSLFGGQLGNADTLVGNAGYDRFLLQPGDTVNDRSAQDDAVINFLNHDSNWSNLEIEVIDRGFAQLYDATGNVELLRDSFPSGDLNIFKYTSASLNGFAGQNTLSTSSRTETIGNNSTTTYTYDREIHIADWDETSSFYNDSYQSVAVHELAHNWDSDEELTAASSNLSSLFDQWLSASGWTQTNRSGNANYSQSTDGQWYYLKSAGFAESYGQTNPHEDFGTVWELYFSGESTSNSSLQAKLNLMDNLFAELA